MSIVRSFPLSARARGAVPMAIFLLVGVVVAAQGIAQAAANPLVSNQASSSGLPIGGQIYDSAILGYGLDPTGSLLFTLFGPDDPTCAGTPLFTTTTEVDGNGYYESSRVVSPAAGTYRWTAVYSGDANNNASAPTLCSDPGSQVSVARRTPNLTTSPLWSAPTASDYAALTLGAGPAGPTGTMTFKLYGPDNMICAGPPIFTSTRNVFGNGWYQSTPFNPSALGTYQWIAAYSGDANNIARSSTCSETGNGFTMTTSNPTVVSANPTVVGRGATVSVTWSAISAPTSGDWLGLYPVGTVDGGPVAAWRYTGGGASGSVTMRFSWAALPGSYEVRLMANSSIQRLATSAPITMVW